MIMRKMLALIFFLFFILPAQASIGTPFTVYGQVLDTDGSPVNAVTVSLTASGGTIYASTANGTLSDGSTVKGYFLFELANLADGVGEGTSMTLTASTTEKSVSKTVARAANEPQRVDLSLSSGGGGSSSSSGGGGGGGGGGGASGELYENTIKRESREEFMVKDLPTTYKFTSPELSISEIVITSNNNAGMINVQVENLKSTSRLVKESPPGTVYKNVNIWVGTAGFAVPENIKEAIIKFRVENSWLDSNNFIGSDIKLVRWDGSKWIVLETREKTKDNTYTYFEAKTNSFSSYAITGLKGTAVPAAVGAETPAKPAETTIPAPAPTKKIPGFDVVLTVAILSVVYVFRLTLKNVFNRY